MSFLDEKRRKGQRTDVYNPLTGNRRFFQNLEDGTAPREPRTVEPPVYEGPGQVFRRRDDAPENPAPREERTTRNRDRRRG